MKAAARRIADPYLRARTDQGVVRVRVEERDLLGDTARIGKIIVVLPCDITPSRQRDAAVERRRKTRVCLMKDANPWDRRCCRGTRRFSSVEPLLIAINSKSVNDWFRIVSSACGRSLAAVSHGEDDADRRRSVPAIHGLHCRDCPKSRARAPE